MRGINKMLVGVGWCTILICFFCMLYYNSIIMWIIRYLFESFVSPLPWSECRTNHTCCLVDKTQYYWFYEHLGITNDIRDFGSFNPTLIVCLIIAWITIFVCIARGIASTGKVVYFSATAPYVVLIILLFRGVTLPGSMDGILYFITPEASALLNHELWGAAASQIFYSLGIGFGAIVSFASFTKNCDNIIRDSIVITIVNCSTSILGGFVIFSIIGYRRHSTGADFEELGSGPGLAFVAIAEAVASMHISPLWAVLFYSMLLFLGVDSLFGLMESMLHQLREEIPLLNRVKKHGFNACVCFTMFLLALPTATNGGLYMIDLMDTWAVSVPLLVAALGEIVAVMWVYGIHRFTNEIYEKTGFKIGWYWQICWMVLSPLVLLVILIFSLYGYLTSFTYSRFIGCPDPDINSTALSGNNTVNYKQWTSKTDLPIEVQIIAMALLFAPVLMIPLGIIHGIMNPDPPASEKLEEDPVEEAEENAALASAAIA